MKLKFTTDDLSSHSEDVETTLVSADLALRTLVRNGAPIYAADEHARREAAALQEFDDELVEHELLVDAVTADAQADLDAITDADPRGLDHMDPDAVLSAAVNIWLAIADRDVLHMPMADLETRARTLVAIGDPPRLAAYAIAIRDRVNILRKQYAGVPLGEVPADITRERTQLAAIAGPIEAALVDPDLDKKRKAAEAQLERARTLRKKISDAKAQAHRQRERDMATSAMGRMGRL